MNKQTNAILDAIAIPAMTYREVLHKVFDENWNSQRAARDTEYGGSMRVDIYLHTDIPAEVAKQALKEFKELESK